MLSTVKCLKLLAKTVTNLYQPAPSESTPRTNILPQNWQQQYKRKINFLPPPTEIKPQSLPVYLPVYLPLQATSWELMTFGLFWQQLAEDSSGWSMLHTTVWDKMLLNASALFLDMPFRCIFIFSCIYLKNPELFIIVKKIQMGSLSGFCTEHWKDQGVADGITSWTQCCSLQSFTATLMQVRKHIMT